MNQSYAMVAHTAYMRHREMHGEAPLPTGSLTYDRLPMKEQAVFMDMAEAVEFAVLGDIAHRHAAEIDNWRECYDTLSVREGTLDVALGAAKIAMERHQSIAADAEARVQELKVKSFDDLQWRVLAWALGTFPHSTDNAIWEHLREEVTELDRALADASPAEIAEEAADCVLLLMHLCGRHHINLREAIEAKFAIVQQRQWGEPDARGVVRHVEPATGENDHA